jgi:PIN domain nuclease of toxin-antitoxin system
MTGYVLDSSAVLAVLLNESGADKALQYFRNGQCCSVNVTEIVARLIDKGRTRDEAVGDFFDTGISIDGFGADLAVLAGRLRAATSHKGLSLGDRACLALAIREGATAVTADRDWATLDLGCKIELIR